MTRRGQEKLWNVEMLIQDIRSERVFFDLMQISLIRWTASNYADFIAHWQRKEMKPRYWAAGMPSPLADLPYFDFCNVNVEDTNCYDVPFDEGWIEAEVYCGQKHKPFEFQTSDQKKSNITQIEPAGPTTGPTNLPCLLVGQKKVRKPAVAPCNS